MNRRQFIQSVSLIAAALPLRTTALAIPPPPTAGRPFVLHLFSKHLQFLDLEPMAAAAAEMGFAGVDLTVRAGGHVDPARVARELPRAAGILRSHGLATTLLTTAITQAADPQCDAVFGAARDAGFRHLRLGYFRFPRTGSIHAALETFKPEAAALAEKLARTGLTGGFQNHAGPFHVGASLWEIWQLIEHLPGSVGVHFDIRHATVERGLSWPIELRLVASRVSALCLKDFRWQENDAGLLRIVNTPLGEGWVDFPRYFTALRELGVNAPASLHLEYPLGGAESGRRELSVPPATVFSAIRRDRATLQRLWAESDSVAR